MIFVTLGSQKFQFDRLLRKVDELVGNGTITDKVFAQTGYSSYKPENYGFKQFLDREEFARLTGMADIVITHGGTGAIIGAVKQGKKVIAVPRLAKYREHVDDHQLQLIGQFDDMGLIKSCCNLDLLGECLEEVKAKEYLTYQSNTKKIIDSIEKYISLI